MTTESPVYNELNKAWKSTCRILLGNEVGELNEYSDWLNESFPITRRRKSHLSGKEVTLNRDHYCNGANFISLDENKEPSIDPLTINEIKDIDSIAAAVAEKWEYCGDRILGNSAHIELSDQVRDSQYVYGCMNLDTTAYAFASSEAGNGKYLFGSANIGDSDFMVDVKGTQNAKRSFCSSIVYESSDIYLSHNCSACQEMMFCFHQINKKHCIGNLELPKEKYTELKKKMLGEINEELKKNKRYPHIYQFVSNTKPDSSIEISAKETPGEEDMKPIERVFSSTFKVLFKRDFKDINKYENWLSNHIVSIRELDTAFGSKVPFPKRPSSWPLPKTYTEGLIPYGEAMLSPKRIVTYPEALELGKYHIEENAAGSIERLKDWIEKYGCFCTNLSTGKNTNTIKSGVSIDATNAYRCWCTIRSSDVGVNSWPGFSKYLFGCHIIYDSQFAVKCYNSRYITRCFEVDTSRKCTDSYFCHNCEGLAEAMFCWNVKGKRYAIGNAQLEPTTYRKMKDALVGQMADEIIKNKELKYDIFNIGCGAR